MIYDKTWYIVKIKWTCESFVYHEIILLLKVRLISTSISKIEPLFFHQSPQVLKHAPFSYFSQNPNALLFDCLLALLWILVSLWLYTNGNYIAKHFAVHKHSPVLRRTRGKHPQKWVTEAWIWNDAGCHTITRSRLKLFLVIGDAHLLYWHWHPFKLYLKWKKKFFLLKILSRKLSFPSFKRIWPIELLSLLCCCHTVTRSCLKLL